MEKKSAWSVDQRSQRNFKVVAAALILLIFAALYFNLGNTYFYQYQVRSGIGFDICSWVCFTGCLALLGFSDYFESKGYSAGMFGFAVLLLIGLGICFAAGFDFNLHGIEPDSMNQFNPNAAPAQP